MIDQVSFSPHFDDGPGKFRIGLILLSNDYTTVRAVEVIDAIEQKVGKPVVTSIQAMFWQSLRTVGYGESIYGYGRLLRTH
jgi:maleate cis-trans isomerase